MRLNDCHNVNDFRRLAKQRLPSPVFHYIDGAADDEITKDRNTAAFADCDLVPNVLVDTAEIDMSVTVMGRKIAMPLMLSPTALQRLFHWQGERAVAATAERLNTWFGISSLATVSIEEIGKITTPKLFQMYVHKDRGLNQSMIERCKAAKFDAIALTVDVAVSGNRERCQRTGFTSPPRFTPSSVLSYASSVGAELSVPRKIRATQFANPCRCRHQCRGFGAGLLQHDAGALTRLENG
jgi:L-lactate dehydrogenase (cytochrome)